MKDNIDFNTYRYFYDSGIIRMNKATKECERFIDGKVVKTLLHTDIEDLCDKHDDIFELDENTPRELAFLESEIAKNARYKSVTEA
jgi:hypothetical protein